MTDAAVRCCPACALRLDGLPVAARFCPWCGKTLPPPAPSGTPQVRERLEEIHALVREHLGDGPPPSELDEMHSLMVLGYADAMCQLAWRYETGKGGILRNPDEARRCYAKSARLGNDYAQARLASVS